MSTASPKVISFSKIKKSNISSEKKTRLKKLLDFFREENVLSKLVMQACEKGFLSIPSIFSDNLSHCNNGFYAGQNVLVFKDKYLGKSFFISQLSCLVYSIYDPEENIFFSIEENESRQTKLFRRILFEAKKNDFNDGVFLGVINGYDRPYHYFYDKAPYLLNIGSFDTQNLKILSLRNEAFLKASFFGSKDEIVADSLQEAYQGRSGFYISPGYPLGFKDKVKINDNFDELIKEKFSGSFSDDFYTNEKPTFIWFGMCSEKRRWVERDAAYKKIILKLVHEVEGVFFIFDGLTRPPYKDVNEFCEMPIVKDEINSIQEFVTSLGEPINYVSLVGSCAEEKLKWAFKTDFFISNALTDSMWCSRFARKPGVCYSSAASYTEIHRQHRHPVSLTISHELIKDTGDKKNNWSKMDFSIDPNVFSQCVFDEIQKYYSFI